MKNWADLTIALPLPPSNNDLVRPAVVRGKVRLVSTRASDVFRARAVPLLVDFAQRNGFPQRLSGPVRISAVWFVPSLASDCNNRWKALEDAVTAALVIWDDDKQVGGSVAEKEFAAPGEEPHCLIRISPRAHSEHERRLIEAGKRKKRGRKQPAAARAAAVIQGRLRLSPNWRPAP